MIDEGYIKYDCRWVNQPSIAEVEIRELNQWRTKLYKLGLIGQYPNGIGFGNISCRIAGSDRLIISGSKTGGIAELSCAHYTKVIDFDWQRNYVTCQGLIEASSETLTHAAIYVAQPEVMAVIHVHHRQLWRKLLDVVPTTNSSCAYGTPEMAEEIIRLCKLPSTQQQGIIVMSGHEEGILTFGNSLVDAGKILLNYLENFAE